LLSKKAQQVRIDAVMNRQLIDNVKQFEQEKLLKRIDIKKRLAEFRQVRATLHCTALYERAVCL
jgi:hypothetical protein